MSVVRRYLVAPALARLVRKERGSARVTEGFFPPQAGRTSFVRVEGSQCHLVLMTTDANGAASEERTEVPRAHGDALLDVCGGKVAYERTALSMGNREALVDRYTAPGTLETVSVVFEGGEDAQGFAAPAWFGPEVTGDAAYEPRALALQGMPATAEAGLSNAALDAVLDLLEHRFAYRYGAQGARAAERPPAADRGGDDTGVMTALRRLAGNVGGPQAASAPTAAPAAAQPEPARSEPARSEPARSEPGKPAAEPDADTRLDDVMEGLSQALGAAVQPAEKTAELPRVEGEAGTFERWSVRPRRAQT